MNWLLQAVPSRQRGAALIIVLAFVVLLTGLGVAYLSRTTSDRQIAHSSFNQSSVDQLAQSAMDNIIGDLRQEIIDGSTASTVNGVTIYTPTSAANIVPQRSGNPATVPNLIRRSVRSDPMPTPGRPSRASAVNSTNDPSANGRAVTSKRWNSHYLVPKADTTTDDSVPISDFGNATPDWVFVTVAGATPAPAPASVIGRYSYAVYDEGGLIDMNLAGYPTGTTSFQASGKISLAFANLGALPYPILNPNPQGTYQVDRVVGWRNYATTQPSNNFPDSTPASQAFARNFQTSSGPATNFYNFVANNPMGPLTVRSDITPYNARTDQMFLGQQELIAFRRTTQFSANALQYLGTFSREAAGGIPQWTGPTAPTVINPNFQTLLVTGSFTRNDGTTANVGDPLVNKPFLLQRLNWLTYRGPSAGRAIPNREPNSGNDPDWDMWLLTGQFGLTSTFLQQGTAANILKYFGLVWDATNERWNYTSPSGGSLATSIATLGSLTGTREPDCFELLQAGIINSSLGDAASSDPALPSGHQQSKLLHILTISANLIAQSRADSYPVRIACSVGGATMEAVGMPRLPCLSSLAACPVAGTGLTGGVNWLLIPNLWDPFRNTWDLTEPSASHLKPPRPPIRITMGGGITFGSATVSQSGSVDPTSVTPFIGTSTGTINSSLTLATGATTNNAFGRDGLLNAMRLGVNDISTTLTLFDPTTSPGVSVVAQWNRVARPTNDTSTYRTDQFAVFRVSLPGNLILPLSVLGKKPVLILQSGFQVSLDYQSPNGQWYSYSFLQGNNASNTWITANPAPGLCLGTSFSQYGINPGLPPPPSALPTIINSGPPLIGQATLWTLDALALAPMFAKADPRSIRYNTMIGVVNVANPPLPFNSTGVIGSIWPGQYTAPPAMSPSAYPVPTPTPNPNPVTLGDNALAGNTANPYSEVTDNTWRPVMMNRPFRSVGEMSYVFRDQPFRTLSFSSGSPSNPSPDAALLDLFSVNDYPRPTSTVSPTPTSTPRAGVISLNSRQAGAIGGVIASTTRVENGLTPSLVGATDAINTGTILASLTAPVINKAGLATLIANANPSPSPSLLDPGVPKTEREAIARALGEAGQARTWNLLIDVIAQSGKYAPGATGVTQANKFVVDGEQRYWVHVAIDRFTGQVIDKQIEVVNE
jgi:Tfp pilus assembly protein PilX